MPEYVRMLLLPLLYGVQVLLGVCDVRCALQFSFHMVPTCFQIRVSSGVVIVVSVCGQHAPEHAF